jgi:hypothetical protein
LGFNEITFYKILGCREDSFPPHLPHVFQQAAPPANGHLIPVGQRDFVAAVLLPHAATVLLFAATVLLFAVAVLLMFAAI